MMLGYSELLKRIMKVDQRELEMPVKILSRNSTTKNRMKVLKALAKHEPITIGMLLQKEKQPRGGGSYLTIRRYFESLEKEGLLKSRKTGTKTLWSVSEEYSDLKNFFLC